MKKYLKTYVLPFLVMALYLITTSQTTKPTTQKQTTSADSTISISEIVEFNAWLRDNVSVNGYQKLTPETTLGELWSWKLRKITASKKALTDSTKKK